MPVLNHNHHLHFNYVCCPANVVRDTEGFDELDMMIGIVECFGAVKAGLFVKYEHYHN